jgi:hypothetical protein
LVTAVVGFWLAQLTRKSVAAAAANWAIVRIEVM